MGSERNVLLNKIKDGNLGYRVNLIAPWVMDTPMSKPLADLCRRHGFPVGDVQRVADAVIPCAADNSICGQTTLHTLPRSFADARLAGRALGIGAAET